MKQTPQFSSAECQAALRLVGECRELGDGPLVWRHHYAASIGNMFDAALVFSAEVSGCLSGSPRLTSLVGWPNANRIAMTTKHGNAQRAGAEAFQADCWQGLFAKVRKNPDCSVAMLHLGLTLKSDNPRSKYFDCLCQGLDHDETSNFASEIGEVLHAINPIDADRDEFDGLTLCRAASDRAFDEREVALVQLIHSELARLVGGPLARGDEPAPSQLPPRGQQVLSCLLEGDGDKQIAARLLLSHHTVNQYTKQIYRYFGVQSRTELLARWVKRGWGARADWTAPLLQSEETRKVPPESKGQRF